MYKTKLILKLETPINSMSWDGGAKSQFSFEVWREPKQDAHGYFVRIECYDANHWFHVARGKSEVQTWANVKRKYVNKLKGINHIWEIQSREVLK